MRDTTRRPRRETRDAPPPPLKRQAPATSTHPTPDMDLATFAAVWDARSEALGHVARALAGEAPTR